MERVWEKPPYSHALSKERIDEDTTVYSGRKCDFTRRLIFGDCVRSMSLYESEYIFQKVVLQKEIVLCIRKSGSWVIHASPSFTLGMNVGKPDRMSSMDIP